MFLKTKPKNNSYKFSSSAASVTNHVHNFANFILKDTKVCVGHISNMR